MRAPQLEHLPRSTTQLTRGTFSSAVMPWPQDGQRERGVKRLSAASGGGTSPASAAHSARHSRSIIFGRRWITTFRNEPMHSPNSRASQGSTAGCASQPIDATLDSLSYLEDRQGHGDHHAADQGAEHYHDHRLHERGERFHR